MKKELTREDFKQKVGYLSYKGKYCEICLEPCFNGCDIAVYDLNQSLLEPKFCTNLKGFAPFENPIENPSNILQLLKLWKLIDKKTNKFYQKHELKKGR